ncbi:MAG: MmcQ/YjbR family DNA-binding protein [Pararhizobium sp.]
MSEQFRRRVAQICSALPGADVSDPWGGGHDAWKVGGRMFALIGAVQEGVSVKCPDIETAEMLKDAGVAHDVRYLHKSWVRLPEETEAEELRQRLLLSYDLVRAKLPAAIRKSLAAAAME